MNTSHHVQCKLIGLHDFIKCEVVTQEAFKIYDKIMSLLSSDEYDPEEFRFWHKKLQKFEVSRNRYKNIVVDIGRNIMSEMHVPVGRRTYAGDGLIAWGSLGDDATAPTISDTLLGNETYRKAIADSSTVSTTVLNVLTFWNLAEAIDQHYEAGEFLDGSVALDSGNLYSHWGIDENKSGSETLSVDSNYTITQ